MALEPVATVARIVIGVGIAIIGLGFWLLLLGEGAAPGCSAGALPERGCASDHRDPALADPGMVAPLFFCVGGFVAAGGIATLVARRVRAGHRS
ncbi:hypothetical protein ACQEVB_04095 [Pseudonocardia sp. CA-107938]|uniref:hypothetical protein n=1 Tax=Pseudonocardia sp. CA-107938 TaxID=3240021 RepID=UPI003D8FC52E